MEDIRWVVITYVLTYASLMLIFGKLGDLLGYRHIFRLGLLVCAAGFLACSLAPTYGLLLLGRILQGIGIALTLSCAPALATSLFDERERTRVLGTYAAITAAGAALGPVVGGFLVERWDWNAVFWFRAPLVLAALALSPLLPTVPRRGSARGFDALGAVLLVTWMSALLLAFSVAAERFGALPLGLALLALAGFAAFMVRESRYPEPIIRPSLFRNVDFVLMNAASIAVHLATFSVLLLVPYYLVGTLGLRCGDRGHRARSRRRRHGRRLVARGQTGRAHGGRPAGARGRRTLRSPGFGPSPLWTPATGLAIMGLSLLVQGVGIGLFQVAYTDLVTATLPLSDRGVAGSLAMVTRTLGIVGGATGLSATFRYFETAALSAGTSATDAFLAAFQSTFFHAAMGLALFLALSLLRPRLWLSGG